MYCHTVIININKKIQTGTLDLMMVMVQKIIKYWAPALTSRLGPCTDGTELRETRPDCSAVGSEDAPEASVRAMTERWRFHNATAMAVSRRREWIRKGEWLADVSEKPPK